MEAKLFTREMTRGLPILKRIYPNGESEPDRSFHLQIFGIYNRFNMIRKT